jgi:hypothetical protein
MTEKQPLIYHIRKQQSSIGNYYESIPQQQNLSLETNSILNPPQEKDQKEIEKNNNSSFIDKVLAFISLKK